MESGESGTGRIPFQNNVTYVVVLWGGMATNLIGCLYLSFKNKSYTDYKKKNVPVLANIIFCALAGTMWFYSFSFMEWEKARWGTVQVLGFYTWHLSF